MSSITASSIPRFSISTSSPTTAPNQFGFTVANNSESPSNARLTKAANSTVPGTSQQTQLQTAVQQQQQPQPHSQQQKQQQQQPQQPDYNSRLPITDNKRKCHSNYSTATITKSRSQSKLIQSNSSHLVYRHTTDRAALNPELFTQISRSTFDLQSDNTRSIPRHHTQRIHSQIHVQSSLFEELRQAQFSIDHQQQAIKEYHNHDQIPNRQHRRHVNSLQDFDADFCGSVGNSSANRLDHLNMSKDAEKCTTVMDDDINPSISVATGESIRGSRTDQLTNETGFDILAKEEIVSSNTNTPNSAMASNGLSYANLDDFMFETRHKPRLSDISESPTFVRYMARKSTENIHNNNNNNDDNNIINSNNNNNNNNDDEDDEENYHHRQHQQTTITTVDNNDHNSVHNNCSFVNEKPAELPPLPSPLLSYLSKDEHENVILTIPNDNDIDNDCPTGHCSSSNPFMIVSLENRDTERTMDNDGSVGEKRDKSSVSNNTVLEANVSQIPSHQVSGQNVPDDSTMSKLQAIVRPIQKQSISKFNSGHPCTVPSAGNTQTLHSNPTKNNGTILNSGVNPKRRTISNITSKQTSLSIQQRSTNVSSGGGTTKTGTIRMSTNTTRASNVAATKTSSNERVSSISKTVTRMPTVTLAKNRTINTTRSGSRASTPASESDCLSLVSNASTASTANSARARKTMCVPPATNNRNAHPPVITNNNRVSSFANQSSIGSRMKNSPTYSKLTNNANGPSSLNVTMNDAVTKEIKSTAKTTAKFSSANTLANKAPTVIRGTATHHTAINRRDSANKNNTQLPNMTSAFKVPGTTKTAPASKGFSSVLSTLSSVVQRASNNTRPSSVASNASSSTNATSLASSKSLSKAPPKQVLTKNIKPNSGTTPLDRRSALKSVPPARSTPVSSKEQIERLKTNVEALKIELSASKKQLKEFSNNFEASIVILRHLDSEYSPFETPILRSELARVKEQHRSIKQEFELSKELSNQQIVDLERDLRAKEELLALKVNEAEEKLSLEQAKREAAETKLIALENASKTPNKKFIEFKERITNYQKEVESLNVVVELKIQRIKELESEKMKLECDLQNYELLKESFKTAKHENESLKETVALKARKNAEQSREIDNLRCELKRERQSKMEESIRADQYKYKLDETTEKLAKLSPENGDKTYHFPSPLSSSQMISSDMTSTPAIIPRTKSAVSRCLFGDEEQFEEL